MVVYSKKMLLTSLKLTRFIIQTYPNKRSSYDFESQVDVNILGHILKTHEIESVNAEIEGGDFDQKVKVKRWRFLYPKYITKYNRENTCKLCEEKKTN
jgi:hypothetical protein